MLSQFSFLSEELLNLRNVTKHGLKTLPILSFYFLKNTNVTIFVGTFYWLLALMVLVQALNGTSIFKTFNYR